MKFLIRRFLACLAFGGVAASIFVYVASFFGLMLVKDKSQLWFAALHLAIFVLYVPLVLIEYSAIRERSFFWKNFKRNKPFWVMPVINLCGALFLVHFLLFLVMSHASSPTIINGHYVLNDHGTIKQVMTEAQYLRLKGMEIRIFPTGWLTFYTVCAAYWWFPRDPEVAEKP